MTSSFAIRSVSLRPPGHDWLMQGLSLTIASGSITTLMGPSGIGKSALLHFICGTLAEEFEASGEVWVEGVEVGDLPPQRRRIGVLFQDDLMFAHWSVLDNLLFALAARQRRAQRRQIALAALADNGLAQLAERDPATLSGGQKARVCLLRVLLAEPKVLLLDEPFSKLDGENRLQFRNFVFAQARRSGLPTLMVTHDRADAEAAGGQVIELTSKS